MRHNIIFNGKFTTTKMTGVHRVAYELINAVDGLLVSQKDMERRVFIAIPNGISPKLALRRIVPKCVGFFSGFAKNILWEQFNLPFVLRPSILVNLCNIGPGLSRNAISMIHDAQVFVTPKSYSPGFRLWYRFIIPIMGRRHRRILTVSRYSKNELVRNGIADENKIVVIHNGCDHVSRYLPDERVVTKNGLESYKFILALSNVQHHKNIGVLLKAFHSLEAPGIKLALFGAASKEDFVTAGHRVPGNVVFLGSVSDEELAGLMTEALAFACPSLTEGFGLPPLEAMMLGCPAIVAPCGALPEVCGEAAIYAEPAEPTQWCNEIRKLAEEPELRKKMAAAGRRQAQKFTWDKAAKELIEVIKQVSGNIT